jgi:hypothetical protein
MDGWAGPRWPSEAADAAALRLFLRRVSYRPGWHLTVHDTGLASPVLQLTYTVPDAYRPGHMIRLARSVLIPPGLAHWPDRQKAGWLRCVFHESEIHEADEWFCLDGRRPFDPHAPATSWQRTTGDQQLRDPPTAADEPRAGR